MSYIPHNQHTWQTVNIASARFAFRNLRGFRMKYKYFSKATKHLCDFDTVLGVVKNTTNVRMAFIVLSYTDRIYRTLDLSPIIDAALSNPICNVEFLKSICDRIGFRYAVPKFDQLMERGYWEIIGNMYACRNGDKVQKYFRKDPVGRIGLLMSPSNRYLVSLLEKVRLTDPTKFFLILTRLNPTDKCLRSMMSLAYRSGYRALFDTMLMFGFTVDEEIWNLDMTEKFASFNLKHAPNDPMQAGVWLDTLPRRKKFRTIGEMMMGGVGQKMTLSRIPCSFDLIHVACWLKSHDNSNGRWDTIIDHLMAVLLLRSRPSLNTRQMMTMRGLIKEGYHVEYRDGEEEYMVVVEDED